MSQKNVLFEDIVIIMNIDKDGKVFEKVSRIEGKCDSTDCKILLDYNSDIYTVSSEFNYLVMLTKSLYIDGTPSPNTFSYDLYSKKSLADRFEYVMYGKVFKISDDSDGRITVFISFGGLILGLTGFPNCLNLLNIDDRVYFFMKQVE